MASVHSLDSVWLVDCPSFILNIVFDEKVSILGSKETYFKYIYINNREKSLFTIYLKKKKRLVTLHTKRKNSILPILLEMKNG
jgi:hypothetical protein